MYHYLISLNLLVKYEFIIFINSVKILRGIRAYYVWAHAPSRPET